MYVSYKDENNNFLLFFTVDDSNARYIHIYIKIITILVQAFINNRNSLDFCITKYMIVHDRH